MKDPTTVTIGLLQAMPLPRPEEGGGKEQRGRVLVIAGSPELSGAALLAGTGVLRVGAGKLQIATCRSIAAQLGVSMPEARVVGLPETDAGGISPEAVDGLAARAKPCSAVLIGPGMMDDDAVSALTAGLIARIENLPVVLDAAAMMDLRSHRDLLRRHQGQIVVTPHPGEMAGILGIDSGEVTADPIGTARHAAELLHCVVALKGACTYVATPSGEAWSCAHGNVGLATSGSGDVLAGFITGLLARGAEPVQATLWGVYLHGEAGNRLAQKRGQLGFLARELLDEAPSILAELEGGRPEGR